MKRVNRPALLNVAALGLLAGLWIGTDNLPAVDACALLPVVAAGAWLLRRRLPGHDRAWPVTTTTLCLAIAVGIGLMKHARSPRLLPPLQTRLLAAVRLGHENGTLHPFQRIPGKLKSLLAAQLAVQVGVIFPLSCLYFGRYALAGLFVNLLAIPLTMLLVPAGMLTALLGAVPVAGPILAWIPARITQLTGAVFLELSHLAASHFPCPEAPDISWRQILAYYCLLALPLFISWRTSRACPPARQSRAPQSYSPQQEGTAP